MGPFGAPADEPAEQGIETFEVQRRNISQVVSSSGSVDSKTQNTLTLTVTGTILEALDNGDTFSMGDVLVVVDNSDGLYNIEQQAKNIESMEGDLAVAGSSLSTARINYQEALDKNHIAIQLAETNTKKAEESAASAFQSLENANISAATAYDNATKALENSANISGWTIKNAKDALDEAERIYEAALGNPGTTPEELATYKYNVELAENAYELAKAQQQANVDSAELGIESTDASNRSSVDKAESSYEQSILDQSSTYWNNLSSLQSAEAQIALTAENIKQAQVKLEQAQIKLDLARMDLESANEDLDDYLIVAPYEGMVLTTSYRSGEYAGQGSSGISIISSEYQVSASVSENDITRISPGDPASITLDAHSNKDFPGEVERIISVPIDEGGIIYYEVLIGFENTEGIEIFHGLSASVLIETIKVEDVLSVPIQSVYKEEGKSYVDLLVSGQVDRENIGQSVQKVEVTTGINDYYYIEITSGLKEGDVIVTSRI
jgi:RND family efflux transporter MFP subunit